MASLWAMPFVLALAVAPGEKTGRPVLEQLGLVQRVRVIVALESAPASAPVNREALARDVDQILAGLPASEFDLRRRFVTVAAFAGDATRAGVAALEADPRVLRIDLDEGGSGHLNQAAPLARVDLVRNAGHTGQGVRTAVIDSGVRLNHPDLTTGLVAEQCFCAGPVGPAGCCPNGQDTQSGAGAAADDNGHGTNVTGIVTSDGTQAPLGGAPDADTVVVKVLDATNSFCCASDVIAAMDWVAVNQPTTQVMNLSLGTFALYAGTCDSANATTLAFASSVATLASQGTMVFASSGNQASNTSMSAPACVERVISVGAVWDSNVGSVTVLGCTDSTTAADKVTCFSNDNATTDLFAPGAPTTSTGLAGATSTYYGTSQASPLAAACAADIIHAYPLARKAHIEHALQLSPTLVTDSGNGLSFPRVDCFHALNLVGELIFVDGFDPSP